MGTSAVHPARLCPVGPRRLASREAPNTHHWPRSSPHPTKWPVITPPLDGERRPSGRRHQRPGRAGWGHRSRRPSPLSCRDAAWRRNLGARAVLYVQDFSSRAGCGSSIHPSRYSWRTYGLPDTRSEGRHSPQHGLDVPLGAAGRKAPGGGIFRVLAFSFWGAPLASSEALDPLSEECF